MASTEEDLAALAAAHRVSKRAGLLERAKGARWAGWLSPRWVFLQVVGVVILGAIAQSQPFLPKASTWILLAGVVVSHLMALGQRIEALVALVESDDVRGRDSP